MKTRVTDEMLDAALVRAKAGADCEPVAIKTRAAMAALLGEGSEIGDIAIRIAGLPPVVLDARTAPHPAGEPVDVPPPALVCSARLP